jgi:hypothetical protein
MKKPKKEAPSDTDEALAKRESDLTELLENKMAEFDKTFDDHRVAQRFLTLLRNTVKDSSLVQEIKIRSRNWPEDNPSLVIAKAGNMGWGPLNHRYIDTILWQPATPVPLLMPERLVKILVHDPVESLSIVIR